jgi:hypothetical protein
MTILLLEMLLAQEQSFPPGDPPALHGRPGVAGRIWMGVKSIERFPDNQMPRKLPAAGFQSDVVKQSSRFRCNARRRGRLGPPGHLKSVASGGFSEIMASGEYCRSLTRSAVHSSQTVRSDDSVCHLDIASNETRSRAALPLRNRVE